MQKPNNKELQKQHHIQPYIKHMLYITIFNYYHVTKSNNIRNNVVAQHTSQFLQPLGL